MTKHLNIWAYRSHSYSNHNKNQNTLKAKSTIKKWNEPTIKIDGQKEVQSQ